MLNASSSLPESRNEPDRLVSRPKATTALCLTLLQMGFTEPSESPRLLVSSYLTVSPLPARFANERDGRFAFCGTFPDLTAGRRYRPSCPMEPGLSSRCPPEGSRPAIAQSTSVAPQSSSVSFQRSSGKRVHSTPDRRARRKTAVYQAAIWGTASLAAG